MKTNIKESIKIIVGILLGTGLVMFLIWFMAGGVMLMPPFIVIPILIVLFTVSFIVAGVMKGYKLAIVVVGSFVFGWFGFNAYYKHTCGPNNADVKVMKPMAEKISAYIVKHGIPESLKDIPDLPYGLVGCERKLEYSKYNQEKFISKVVASKDKADFYNVNENCNFLYNNRVYYIELSEGISIPIKDGNGGNVAIGNKESRTWASLSFGVNSIKKIVIDYDFTFGSSKNTGICNPMRQ